MKGAEDVIEGAKEHLGINLGETTADGIFTIESCECLGRCSAGPSMILNEQYMGVLSSERIKSIIDQTKNK